MGESMEYKYKAVADLIRKNISSRNCKSGEKLPSIQMLSKELNYSAETIVKAYKQHKELLY